MIDINKHDELLKRAINKWGPQPQMMMGIEECSELIHEISKWFRGRESNIAEELADTLIILRQISIYIGEENVIEFMDKKIERLQKRLEE
jgi:NTP pyrophosphatase (non-canonical NTP hydrolase)